VVVDGSSGRHLAALRHVDSMKKSTQLVLACGTIATLLAAAYFAWPWFAERVPGWRGPILEPAQLRAWLLDQGTFGAPLAFIGVQIVQVVLAPIPGEASGFLGGYLFGTWAGFIYSSLGLTVGSIINFGLGRCLGRRFVDRYVPSRYVRRLDTISRHQGVLLFLVCFLFPGFPKDYLCLFIGVTPLPVVMFVLLAGLGRMPGTFMLSLQGAQVLEKDYVTLVVLVGISLALILPVYVWRRQIYAWADKKTLYHTK